MMSLNEEQNLDHEKPSFYIGDKELLCNSCEELQSELVMDNIRDGYFEDDFAEPYWLTSYPCMECCDDVSDYMDIDEVKQVIVGVCAMEKKSTSKPMTEILLRLNYFEYIKAIIFPEDVILNQPVEDWPSCDCLISFHSRGFPLEKALEYAELRKPYLLNNLEMQIDIQNRCRVYSILENEGIELPRYAICNRESPNPEEHDQLEEFDDYIEINGVVFNKPFVEKPISAEDHNIYIYYPTSTGGGCQKLFRKIGSRSSVYSGEARVRRQGSYIYEDFMPTDGTDVKVYTVGPEYAHAEARKSPALDGKVERDREGKEIRYPVILSNSEKLIARKVCNAFKQTVCGFDLLRANGKSYVCDVNGFSFVKNSAKYYDDCAKIIGNMILRQLAPSLHIPWEIPFQLDDPPIVPTTAGKMMELRCVVAVMRHGDRTPKQKMKMEVRHQGFFTLFEKYGGYKDGHAKLKKPRQLQEVLDLSRTLLLEIEAKNANPEVEILKGKLEQLKSVLEMYGHFSGINRKVQLKYQPKGRPRHSSSDDETPKDPSLVLILKWGGELTPAGRKQAEELGRKFRCEYAGIQGLGLLRLHSTYRHDLKIYASDEGRVQMTAAAFAKGLLALEGELTPILAQMVKSANTNGLLDDDCEASKFQSEVKNRLHELLQLDRDFTKEDCESINPSGALSVETALTFIRNPVKCCEHILKLVRQFNDDIRKKKEDPALKDTELYYRETWELMARRWGKLEKDFRSKDRFDISKIPDIYDCAKYDIQHNFSALNLDVLKELYTYSKYMADLVVPQEYGMTIAEKLAISQGICSPLLKKIRADLQSNVEVPEEENVNRLNPRYSHGVSSPGRHVRTRLYFTSESHIHSLLTMLRYGGLNNDDKDEQWGRAMEYVSRISELSYLTQIVIMAYEDTTKDPASHDRFHIELHFSPGVNCCVEKDLPPGPGFRPQSRNESKRNSNSSDCSVDGRRPSRIDEEDDSYLDDDAPLYTPMESPASPIVGQIEASLLSSIVNGSLKSQPIAIRVSPTTGRSRDPTISQQVKHDSRSNATSSGSRSRPRSLDRQSNSPSRSVSFEDPAAKSTSLQSSEIKLPKARFSKGAPMLRALDDDEMVRRHRHSIAGHVSGFTWHASDHSTRNFVPLSSSLFSTAVISGSSSAPDLSTTLGPNTLPKGVPPIRALETLHNSLSLKQLDDFLDLLTSAPFRTPLSTPPRCSSPKLLVSHPPSLGLQSPTSSLDLKGPSSTVSSSGQSSPNSTNHDFLAKDGGLLDTPPEDRGTAQTVNKGLKPF
ncbi:inositol hexakisphosphate and diphosphoinositol-pentakisphosphate kinase-like isoform X3 [Artemia franciscana]|uniref:inositol hexakisphosphate and diphosphoinositol-pentakisphosphate kinase-like isoform X3 n=1 Tax=Artemia franciscana TaxID=6661 RepID=UPI0032DB644B